ncbi:MULTISPECIES: YugN family protein [Thermoactinomyces]|jgi:hypothetical protein|uniref:YugN-like family protein n=1 Tax=Thermoactinomyces daqus TaxID=1329516 RepID=A0A7W1X9G9_9BACL|nr:MULTISPECIES: YugN family protein [Thermoactinomyces]MBA4542509.1 hypothetical protein [Thermoactinomyces daqus]MBH8603122.1 hypothetical protein [Thermoactinomyces sp. CICC 10522]MBH8607071.1 hypothetical protein [Thermoactinomyces sp. CICC 10521]
MLTIDSSKIEGFQTSFGTMTDLLYPEGFVLGGGWTYEHGYFDHPLDWENEQGYRYYLRIPVYVVKGEMQEKDAIVRLGKPFVIKHEFRTKNDPSADIGVVSSLVNQFSEPLPTDDAKIGEEWSSRARQIVAKIENKIETHLLESSSPK